MKPITTLILTALVILPAFGAGPDEADRAEVGPAILVSQADLKILEENNRLLKDNHKLVENILEKQGLEPFEPQLPQYHMMSSNSVMALLNQLDYTRLAHKVGAPIPKRPTLETGKALQNNRFLHVYNNSILRSIGEKLGLSAPAPIDLQNGSIAEQNNKLIKQNADIVGGIAKKLEVTK